MTDDTMDIRDDQPDAEPGLLLRLENRLGILGDLRVVGYRSHATHDRLVLRGRVIEAKAERGAPGEESLLENVKTTLRRLESDEIPGAVVAARLRGREWRMESDEEGFVRMEVDPGERLEPGWHDVDLEVLEAIGGRTGEGVLEVLVPPPDAGFGVVSDLDDTVVRTNVNDLVQQVRMVFGRSAHSRPDFPGVDEFYRALHRGSDGEGANPFFYVSRSGWNLYDLFVEFLDHHGLPRGPLYLQDIYVVEDPSRQMGIGEEESHKIDRVRTFLETYPELPLVLIGDSGQEDPELYAEIARSHPGRIRAIYVRDVTPEVTDERDREVRELARDLEEETGVPMVPADDTAGMARHAQEIGLVTGRALREVEEAVERERAERAGS